MAAGLAAARAEASGEADPAPDPVEADPAAADRVEAGREAVHRR
jgi:hypothetical protein